MDPHHGSWDDTKELLAIVADRLEIANYLFLKAHTPERTVIPKPQPIPRPGVEIPKKALASSAELARFFGRGVRYTNGGDPQCP